MRMSLYKELKKKTRNFREQSDVKVEVNGASYIVSLAPLHKYYVNASEYMDYSELQRFYQWLEPEQVAHDFIYNELPCNLKSLWKYGNIQRVGFELDTGNDFEELEQIIEEDYEKFKKWIGEIENDTD